MNFSWLESSTNISQLSTKFLVPTIRPNTRYGTSLEMVKNDHGKKSEMVRTPRCMRFTYENCTKYNRSWYYQVLFFKKKFLHILIRKIK